MLIILGVILVVALAHWTGLGVGTVLIALVAMGTVVMIWLACRKRAVAAEPMEIRVEIRTRLRPRSNMRAIVSESDTQVFLTTGLIIWPDPLENILSGRKIWEMRSRRVRKRERIALIEKGTKRVLGVAELVDCIGPLSRDEMTANYDRHCIAPERIDAPAGAKYRYAWVLANVQRLHQPVICPLKHGVQTFVSIPRETAREIVGALDASNFSSSGRESA